MAWAFSPGDYITADSKAADARAQALAALERERDRRLSIGFEFDFADERGVHHIATTDRDMKGWDQVTKIAAAALALELPQWPIEIRTETGLVTVTALEWQDIMLAAGAFGQPIWQASFVLASMNPLPADITDDTLWP